MTDTPAPHWVVARQTWDLSALFSALRSQVESDVAQARPTELFSKFEVSDGAYGGFSVARHPKAGGMDWLQFTVEDDSVVVLDVRAGRHFRARPAFGPSYERLVQIEGENELQPLWQLSRKSLEPFLFPM